MIKISEKKHNLQLSISLKDKISKKLEGYVRLLFRWMLTEITWIFSSMDISVDILDKYWVEKQNLIQKYQKMFDEINKDKPENNKDVAYN